MPRPPQYKLKVRRSEAGLGLFADEDIPKGRFVIEYWGRIAGDAEVQRVGGRYLFELGDGKTILGGNRKNLARYANHSCRPSCETRQTGDRVTIWSRRRVRKGEPITYDYGKEYFDAYIKPHGCRCAKCRR